MVKHLCQDYQNIVDWNGTPALETETFTQSFTFNAMNRPVTVTKADGTIEQYGYNKAGLLETLSANVRGATSPTNFVTNIDYNEKGQRLDIYYGNGSKTKYVYDPLTFRLTRLLTTRNTGADILQDLNYTYDPVGNITQITDNAQQTHYFSNTVVSPTGTYTYDALYRLKSATGRELSPLAMSNHTDFVNTIDMPNSASNAMQIYTQQFVYDELGNIQTMSSQGQWTRNYFYNSNDNYLLGHTSGTTEYTYDEHGNMTSMPHINVMGYDQDDQLKAAIFPSAQVYTYYCYDSTGNRTRKVVQKPGNIIEDHIYLGGCEIYRKKISNTLNFERETLTISDDQKAIVRIETKTVEYGSTISNPVSNKRYQYDNHLGSACLELDSSAAIISYEEYHPFGTTSYRAGSSQTEVSLKRYKYCGKERDEETGLYYYGARYYAAWIGRFVSVDPLQFKYPYYTPYQYAGNKPISYIDLDGLEEELPTLNIPHERNKDGYTVYFNHETEETFIVNRVTGLNPDKISTNTERQFIEKEFLYKINSEGIIDSINYTETYFTAYYEANKFNGEYTKEIESVKKDKKSFNISLDDINIEDDKVLSATINLIKLNKAALLRQDDKIPGLSIHDRVENNIVNAAKIVTQIFSPPGKQYELLGIELINTNFDEFTTFKIPEEKIDIRTNKINKLSLESYHKIM